MKRVYQYILTSIILFTSSLLFSQSHYIERIKAEREAFEKELLHTDEVLNQAEKDEIKQLKYFDIDSTWVLKAKFKRKKGRVFEMPTTTERKPKYRRLGYLYFERNEEKFRLTVFQNIDLVKLDEYRYYVFIPFRDGNSPEKTYGGGRYLDLKMKGKEKHVLVDFNLTYNPYCVYSHRYSCPITPTENHISVHVNAGVQNPEVKSEE